MPSVSAELAGIDLGDSRRNARAVRMAETIAKEPSLSLPKIFADSAAIEGTYRLLNNEHVTFEDLLQPHVAQTVARVQRSNEMVLALHDTSEFKFSGEYRREGLGWLPNGGQGFFAHVALAASYDPNTDVRDPLGVLAVQTIFRAAQKRSSSSTDEPESTRWTKGIEDAEAVLGAHASVIHVADREADAYAVLSLLCTKGLRFVLRGNHNRNTVKDGATERLWDAVGKQPVLSMTRNVTLSARKPSELETKSRTGKEPIKQSSAAGRTLSRRTAHPARTEREAILHVSTGTHMIQCPSKRYKDFPTELSLNVVRVFEPDPPDSIEPIGWLLFTSEPISTPKEIERVIDAYRARWLIEEFFKALKTGCAFEKLQLENRNALLNAFGIYLPVAWRLLRLRTLARLAEARPATDVLTLLQVKAIKALSTKPFPANPTLQEALLAIAGIGGHIKNNGPPGWIVLGRGFHDVLIAEAAFHGAGIKM